jgi:hypothetical protein
MPPSAPCLLAGAEGASRNGFVTRVFSPHARGVLGMESDTPPKIL